MARILVIDDDDSIRLLVAEILAAAGHAVTTADGGTKGAKLFRAAPCDLILTDIVMAEGEGLETIIKLHREFPAVPIIAMSGGSSFSTDYLEMAAKLGAARTLNKPFSGDELIANVDRLLQTGGGGTG